MHRKTLTAALMLLSAFTLSGATCKRVVINDHELCSDKGALGARCNFMLSDHPRNPDFDTWAKERFGQVSMSSDAWTEIIGAVLKLCDQTQRCTWVETEQLKGLLVKVEEL